MPAKIAIYLRVSTNEQSCDSQRHAAKLYLKQNHINSNHVKWFEEKRSGATTDRPELQRVLWQIDHKRIDTLIVHSLSRLARNTKDGLTILSDLANRGIKVISLSENIEFNSTTGKLIASILLSVATWERETIRNRIKAGLDNRRAQGKSLGRPQNHKKYQQVLKMRESMSVAEIALKLNETRQSVYYILQKGKELKLAV